MISDATVMSKPVARAGALPAPLPELRPVAIWRSARSFMSSTRRHVTWRASSGTPVAVGRR